MTGPDDEKAVRAGDEVQVMLRHGLAPIAVDANRYRAGRLLETPASSQPPGIDLHILDDGFQHLALARDLDIVLLDSSRPPWQDELLPAGRLREPLSALRRAAVVVLTRMQDWTALEPLLAPLRDLAPQAEIYLARTRLVGQVDERGERQGPAGSAQQGPGSILRRPVLAFAGLGNPKAFFADLCVAGVQVVGTKTFRDHHRYTGRDLRRLERQARLVGAERLVTTEKDAVNLPPELRVRLYMPLCVMGMEMEVERGRDLVDRVEKLIRK